MLASLHIMTILSLYRKWADIHLWAVIGPDRIPFTYNNTIKISSIDHRDTTSHGKNNRYKILSTAFT